MITLADRARWVEPFLAMEVMERAMELAREGRDILHLAVGEPDFPPPAEAVRATHAALEEGATRYTDSRGLYSLRQAIVRDCRLRRGVEIDVEQVVVANGTSPAMLLVFLALIDPGCEVILGTPHYPCYPNFIRVAGGVPVEVPTRAEEGYRLDPDAVAAAITPRTRAIILASPANPTGAIQDAEVVRALAALGPPLVSDEIYDGLVYGGCAVTSPLRFSEDCFVLDGFSKRYSMTGFRLGYAIVPRSAARAVQTLAQSLFISTNHFVQRAGIAALESGASTTDAMCRAYVPRRDLLVEGLRALGLRVPHTPAGAFYVFAEAGPFARLGAGTRDIAFALLERAGVAVTPGIDFGAAGEGWLRLSYAFSERTICEALERLAKLRPAR